MSDEALQIRFGGLGGQGLVTLGAVLAEAGARQGLRVAASQSYGSRARGGATRSDVILAQESVDFPHVIHPDVLMVLAEEAYELYRADLREGSLVLSDPFFVKTVDMPGVVQARVDATEVAMDQVGSKMAANFVMFGAFLGYTKTVGVEAVEGAMAQIVRARFLEVNL